MMGFLTEPMEDIVRFGRRKYFINAAFDIVLDVQRLYREELPDMVKLNQALKMFGIGKPEKIELQTRADLLNDIYKNCINTKQRPPVKQQLPVFDFEEDAEYIYASFMLDYGIDLIDAQGQLHWKKFIALFQGLSEQTKIREVMKIRSMEIPRYDGHNQKQIQEIQELKSYYALPVRGGGGQQGLDALFSALEAQAVRNG
ncbi:bacteriophage Gp15 family protein [Blautia producta]|uniref:Gp15 family bacteriophage protein n=1 Tax=Blautia TaxID=572511 RepID=UPI001D038340|nr:Gp15 family bacteriophage protein [Blautia producta]MCB5878431.1 bacteriophage Gp15 family protein [Blautia producta]